MATYIPTMEGGQILIRLAKVIACRKVDRGENSVSSAYWVIYLEGELAVKTEDADGAQEVIDFLTNANASDVNFFGRSS